MRRGRKRARAIRLKRSRLRRKSKADACADGQKPAGWLAGLGTLRLASRHQIHGGASAGERAWHLDATSAPHGRRRKRSFLTGFLAPCTLCANPTVVGRSLARPLRPFKWHGPFTYRSLLSWATSVGAKWLTIEDRNAGEKQKSGRKIADRFVYVRECACVWGGGVLKWRPRKERHDCSSMRSPHVLCSVSILCAVSQFQYIQSLKYAWMSWVYILVHFFSWVCFFHF